MNGRFWPKTAAEGTGRETTPARPLYTPTKGQQSPDLIACVGNVSGCPIRKNWWARQDYSPRNAATFSRIAIAMLESNLGPSEGPLPTHCRQPPARLMGSRFLTIVALASAGSCMG